MNHIFCVPSGELPFNDNKHMTNFVKYLFSKSSSHTKNTLTDCNFYQRKQDDQFQHGFLTDLETKYQRFLETLDADDFDNYRCDVFDMYFILYVDNKLITNMFVIDNNQLTLCFDKHINAYIERAYLNNKTDSVFALIETVCEHIESQNLNVINYYDLTEALSIEEIKEVELLMHRTLRNNFEDNSVIYQISHNDQVNRPYHIHRLKYMP